MTDYTFDDLFPSRYVKAADIGENDMNLTIAEVLWEELDNGTEKKTKPAISFVENEKVLVLNVTNGKTIRKLHGEPFNWPGKRITLYTTEVEFSGNTTLGVRVRMRVPQPHPAVVQAVTEPEAPPPWEE